MIEVTLSEELEQRLAALARRTGESPEFHAVRAVTAHIDELEAAHLPDSGSRG